MGAAQVWIGAYKGENGPDQGYFGHMCPDLFLMIRTLKTLYKTGPDHERQCFEGSGPVFKGPDPKSLYKTGPDP